MTGKLLFPAYISDANEDSMPREYGVDATNLPTISSVGGDLPGVDSNMEADFRRRNKFRTNHFMLQRDGEILSELRIASMTITDDCGPDEEPGSTQHHTSEIDYGLSINQPINYKLVCLCSALCAVLCGWALLQCGPRGLVLAVVVGLL